MSEPNKLIVHISVDGKNIDAIVKILQENNIVIDAISTKERYDVINYKLANYVS